MVCIDGQTYLVEMRANLFYVYRFSELISLTDSVNSFISSVLYFVCTRFVDAGCFARLTPVRRSVLGRIGRGDSPPPQFGHTL